MVDFCGRCRAAMVLWIMFVLLWAEPILDQSEDTQNARLSAVS